jgi:hypothetical protein
MNAVALEESGVPLGLVGHLTWVRPECPRPAGTRTDVLPLQRKETRYWLQVAHQVVEGWRASGYAGTPWLLLDAGGDAREVLQGLVWSSAGAHFTVRCGQDRRCSWPLEGRLREVADALPARGYFRLPVPASESRTARRARMAVRFCSVVLPLCCPRTGRPQPVELLLVHAREEGTCPRAEAPLDWMLLTNAPVGSLREARRVVRGYALRWRVEEVHRSWKTGCQVERSGLTYGPFSSWAALLLCVAVRIERLKRLSREQPQAPADGEFSPHELQALLLLKKRGAQYTARYVPTLGEAVLWLAELGGYTGKSSGGPPGATTLKRGLDKLESAAEALRFQQELSRRD